MIEKKRKNKREKQGRWGEEDEKDDWENEGKNEDRLKKEI